MPLKRRIAASVEEGMSIKGTSCGPVSSNNITILVEKTLKMASKATLESDLSGVSDKSSQVARNQSPQILDDFMERIADSDKYLEQGILNFSFTEAAMLLQTSADLYGKKVDLLWDCIFEYQKRMLMADVQQEDKEKEMEKLEERKRKYKRKRRLNADQVQTTNLVKQLSWGDCDNIDYMNKQYDVTDLWQEWYKFDKNTSNKDVSQLQTPQSSFHSLFQPCDPIHNDDKDYIGRYDQFHSANIISEIFDLESRKLLPDERGCVTRMRMDCHVINDFLRENPFLTNQPRASYAKELNIYINEFFENRQQHQNETICILQQQLRRYSCAADSGLEEDRFSLISEHCSSPIRNKSISQDSAFEEEAPCNISIPSLQDSGYLSFPSQEDDSDHCADVDRESDAPEKTIASEKQQEIMTLSAPTKKNKILKDRTKTIDFTHTKLSTKSSVILTRNKRPLPWTQILKEGTMEVIKTKSTKEPLKKRRLSKKALEKLSKGMTVKYRTFEKFFRDQYTISENEGDAPPCLSGSEESVNEFSDDDDIPPPLPESELEIPEEVEIDNVATSAVNLPTIGEPQRREIAESRSGKLERLEIMPSTSMSTTVKDWRRFITPILKSMEAKADFDIHEYGSRILDSSDIGQTRHFKDIVSGKSSAEVSRYFIATLQLANTLNVEIRGATPGVKANDSFALITKDKTRYHEALEDYQAPSEETFQERLSKVNAYSTPYASSPSKKRKLQG